MDKNKKEIIKDIIYFILLIYLGLMILNFVKYNF